VTTRPHSSFSIVFILGLLAMLMPLSIDMYLPALPVISAQFGVPAGSAQMTLSTYILGFAVGQLLYGPMADSLGRKPVILGGTLVFAAAAVACALAQTIDQLIVMRFFHGLAAAAASVVINALEYALLMRNFEGEAFEHYLLARRDQHLPFTFVAHPGFVEAKVFPLPVRA
jgi:DHA1 family bicyclomycin/chloramphenicol resistance-like MFS transporter